MILKLPTLVVTSVCHILAIKSYRIYWPKKKNICTGAFQLTIRVGHNGFRVVVRKLK